MPTLGETFRRFWNVFRKPRSPTGHYSSDVSYVRPDRHRLIRGRERSIITAIFTRIAVDASAATINHAATDENGRFRQIIPSGLNACLNIEANIDQSGRAFLFEVYMNMLEEGCVAIVPVDTDVNPAENQDFDILSLRVGHITKWLPSEVEADVYNEKTGKRESVTLPKRCTAIVENPFYAVMNEPNSTFQRLIRKLALLDAIDEQSGSGKMDLIIQLPYSVKSELRKAQAEERRADIERQLTGSKYGIAYIDSTEHVTQLGRSLENNLLQQITYLTEMFYSQLGVSKEVFDGTADEKVMLNYNNRTIEPIIDAVVAAMRRSFISRARLVNGETIVYFRDPLRLVPANQLADIADRLTRNEILTPNEIRGVIGFRPSDDPKSDELRNRNISESDLQLEQDQQIAQNGSEEPEYYDQFPPMEVVR